MFYNHTLEIPTRGDFIADGKYTFEIGGKNKAYHQISGVEYSFVAADDIEFGFQNKIPLWLFGFLHWLDQPLDSAQGATIPKTFDRLQTIKAVEKDFPLPILRILSDLIG